MSTEALLAAFRSDGRPRVWSLIVTIMGDMIVPRGGRVPVAVLSDILNPLGISESALRTALSRLTQDGWVISAREGRSSFYRLTPHALAETSAASLRIYAPPLDQSLWVLGVGSAPPDALSLNEGWVHHGPPSTRCGLHAKGLLNASSDPMIPAEHAETLASMARDINAAEQASDSLTARLLLIHRWRRICLKFPETPAMMDPGSADGLRADMARAYADLWNASEAALTTLGAPSPTDTAPTGRFRP